MEGFWTVNFAGVQGFGAGVITLVGGQVFGGDSGMMYSGTYKQQGNTLNARVHVKRHAPGTPSVMGRDEFDLEMTGTLNGNTITATGQVPGTPLALKGTLTRQGTLPERAHEKGVN